MIHSNLTKYIHGCRIYGNSNASNINISIERDNNTLYDGALLSLPDTLQYNINSQDIITLSNINAPGANDNSYADGYDYTVALNGSSTYYTTPYIITPYYIKNTILKRKSKTSISQSKKYYSYLRINAPTDFDGSISVTKSGYSGTIVDNTSKLYDGDSIYFSYTPPSNNPKLAVTLTYQGRTGEYHRTIAPTGGDYPGDYASLSLPTSGNKKMGEFNVTMNYPKTIYFDGIDLIDQHNINGFTDRIITSGSQVAAGTEIDDIYFKYSLNSQNVFYMALIKETNNEAYISRASYYFDNDVVRKDNIWSWSGGLIIYPNNPNSTEIFVNTIWIEAGSYATEYNQEQEYHSSNSYTYTKTITCNHASNHTTKLLFIDVNPGWSMDGTPTDVKACYKICGVGTTTFAGYTITVSNSSGTSTATITKSGSGYVGFTALLVSGPNSAFIEKARW